MPRFQTPSAWFSLFCAALFALCLALANWQDNRANLKQRLQDEANANLRGAPVTPRQLSEFKPDFLWRPARVTGTYAGESFLVDNRIHEHKAGFHVISPLSISDSEGLWLLVNRGWLAAPATRRRAVQIPAPPEGEVTVAGVLAPDGSNAFELEADSGEDNIWQNLKIGRWANAHGKLTVPAVLLAKDPGSLLAQVELAPDYRANTSRGYRLQWLAFAVIVALGWVGVGLHSGKELDSK